MKIEVVPQQVAVEVIYPLEVAHLWMQLSHWSRAVVNAVIHHGRAQYTSAALRVLYTAAIATVCSTLEQFRTSREFVMIEWNFSPRCSYMPENSRTWNCFQFNCCVLELHSREQLLCEQPLIRKHFLRAWIVWHTLASPAEILHLLRQADDHIRDTLDALTLYYW